jgi:hypothetical protein
MVVQEGEFSDLEVFLSKVTLNLGLYKNVLVPSGPITYAQLQEMPTGSGVVGARGYVPIQLTRVVNYNALALNQWFLSLNTQGKVMAQFSNVPQQWIMTAQEVADANTVQGSFKFFWKLPFTGGGANKPAEGTEIKGVTSGATAYITAVNTLSGSWTSGGNATGYFYLETKNGNFQNGENLEDASTSTLYAVSASGTKNAGDAWKQLYDVIPMATPQVVNAVGLLFQINPVLLDDNDTSITG